MGSVNRINWTGSFQKSENRRAVGSQVSQSFSKVTDVIISRPEINIAQTMCVQTEPDTFKQNTTEAFRQITHQTENSKAKAKEEKETLIHLQVNHSEGSDQADIQDQTQVLSLSLKTLAEGFKEAEADDFGASATEGVKTLSHENAKVRVSAESSQNNTEDNERKGEIREKEVLAIESVSFTDGLDQMLVLSNVPTGDCNKVMAGADTFALHAIHVPFGGQNANDIAESVSFADSEAHTIKLSLTENANKAIDHYNEEATDKKEKEEVKAEENFSILKTVQSSACTAYSGNERRENSYVGSEIVLNPPDTDVNHERETEVVNSFDVICEVKVDLAGAKNEVVNLADKPLRSIKSKKTTNRSDSGVTLSSSSTEEGTEEVLSSADGHMFIKSPTEPVTYSRQEMCLSPVDTDVLVNMSDQVFCPLDLDARSPGSLLNPQDQDMCLSPNNDTCLSPPETKGCLSPNFGEEDEDVCLSPTEANIHIRPLEKYVLTTKEEEQSLSYSGDQTLPKEDRKQNVSISERDNGSVCFGSFEDEVSRVSVISTNNSYKLTSQGIRSRPEFGGTGECSVIADKDQQLGFEGLYRRSSNAPSPIDSSNGRKDSADKKSVNNQYRCPGGRPESGRFERRGSGEYMVYSTLGQRGCLDDGTSKEEKDNSPSVERNFAISTLEPGRFGSKGSGEWKVYGGNSGRISNSPGTRSELSMPFATSPPQTFGSIGTGEWLVSSASLKRTYSQGGSDDLQKTVRRESRPTPPNRAASPIETGRFGSRGSGEWRVYGGATGRISRWGASSSLPNADSKEIPLADRQLATSPPTRSPPPMSPPPTSPPVTSPLAIPRTGRFSSGGSGEWRIYGGSPGRVSSAGNTDSANCGRIISPPSSRPGSAQRLSSSGSGGRLSSGSVVRRSSSAGSGGQLSGSSGSHRTSSSGRYATAGSGEWKPGCSSLSGRGSSGGSAGMSGGLGKSSSQRAPSPGGRMGFSVGSGGQLSGFTAGGGHMSSPGSGSKLGEGGSNDRISSQPGGRISSSSGSGRTSSSGGRVISSSNRSNRSTGSGAGSTKERISVCKMAALSISAAGRERQKDKRTQAQKSQPVQAGGESVDFS